MYVYKTSGEIESQINKNEFSLQDLNCYESFSIGNLNVQTKIFKIKTDLQKLLLISLFII